MIRRKQSVEPGPDLEKWGPVYHGRDYRAIAPLNAEHAKTFAVLSEAYRSVGYPE